MCERCGDTGKIVYGADTEGGRREILCDCLLFSRMRFIGQKEILPLIEFMYDIHTWRGALKFIQRRHLPMRRTPSKRPMFLGHELISFDQKFLDAMREAAQT